MPDRLVFREYYRRNLPHLQSPGATYFVTFRLAGSLPRSLLDQHAAELQEHKASLARQSNPELRARLERDWRRRWFGRFEKALDQAALGPRWLGRQAVATMVCESLRHRHGRAYRLDAYCVMPNHVHVVFAPLPVPSRSSRPAPGPAAGIEPPLPRSLAAVLHSLKGYTARRANLLLQRQGAFWEHESYDHAIRDEEEWLRILAYVVNNPVKARLTDAWEKWPWSYLRPTP